MVLFALVLAAGATTARSATITVTNGNDSGAGSLRQAVTDASPGDTINFTGTFPQVILVGELLINKRLTIAGPGADKLWVQHSSSGPRVVRIPTAIGPVTISGLSITKGHAKTEGGAGILNQGTLTLDRCMIFNNAIEGGQGAGISNDGTLTIRNSTVYDNHARFFGEHALGGAIANSGSLTISNSTISGNTADDGGGGIANLLGGTLRIENSTVSGNGPIFGVNDCGGGIWIESEGATARNTIIAKNSGTNGPDVCGTLTSEGFNLIGNNDNTDIDPQASDLIGTSGAPIDPLLGVLTFNGGSTRTLALQSNSPAIDSGDPNAPARDQRGYLRAEVSDRGAFEFAGTIPVSLANISTRLRVETGNDVLIGGFIIGGSTSKKVIVRAIGPSLPLADVLADPTLEIRDVAGSLIASNDNWRSDQEAEIIATTIPPANDLESAIVATLPAYNSAYTATVRGANNGTGLGVVEVYDLDRTAASMLANISTRGLVQTDPNVLIAGTIVVGQDSQKVILRGIGPSLNISGKLADPTMELRDGNGALIRSNDNWRSDQEAEIIATTIPPSDDLESAIVQTLTPGTYTAVLRGVNNTTGIAVVEAYGLN